MKVNMTPNPLDVVTIHASQGDTEARQWEFELHNNGELIDTSEITEQLFFKAYKGGTEQILPENTSTPTTSPFKGDIKYPQGLLSDQEFLYRESPTEEDGLAKITDIKGNTLVWNQLVEKGNMTDGWTFSNSTGSYSNNVLTFTASAQGGFVRPNNPQSIVANHKYLTMVDVKATSAFTSTINFTSRNLISINITTNWQTFSLVFTNTITEKNYFPRIYDYRQSGWDAVQIRNCMIFDLTQMGLDSVTAEEFTSLFPLPYYSYNQGTLLSFNGNGIKTVGKNLLPLPIAETKNGITLTHNDDGSITLKGTSTALVYFDFSTNFDSSKYEGCLFTCRTPQTVEPGVLCRISQSNRVGIQDLYINNEETVQDNGEGLYFAIRIASGTVMPTDGYTLYPMLRMPNQDSTFEPYTSSTLSLPISTYFPTGMKSAGTAYDELTPNKATTRLKEVTFSSVSAFDSSGKLGVLGSTADAVNITRGDEVPNDRAVLETYSLEGLRNNDVNGITQFGRSFYVRLQGKTTLAEYNTYLSANPLTVIYELATPTETSFTTASLVTENAEIPLSNEDGVLIGKCTEQLSSESGFIDAKIKLADEDGDVYSNKIQLHVERSPQ